MINVTNDKRIVILCFPLSLSSFSLPVSTLATLAGVLLHQHYKRWTSVTLWLGQRLVLAGRHLLFVNNEYAYLFIRAHQPLRYQREGDN